MSVTETDRVLADMLTENTGRHMLDSGGAYGRSWERNQGKTAETFLANPPVRLQHGEFVTLDVFHWLRARLEYDPVMDRKLQVWNALFGENMAWLEVAETFASKVSTGDADSGRFGGYLAGVTNSYNHEESLSQTIQFVIFEDRDGETVVLLQIHGGCDVRGGYTRPRAFRVGDDAGCMFDFDAFSVGCTAERDGDALPGMPDADPHVIDHRNGEWINYGGSFERDPWNGEEWIVKGDDGEPFIRCPYCTEPTPMELYEYPVG